MLRRLLRGDVEVVYGSRYLRPDLSTPLGLRPRCALRLPFGALRGFIAAKHPNQSWAAYLGGRSLSIAAWLACGVRITDTVTALKLFPRDVIVTLPLETTGFELDHEITARLAAQGRRFAEVQISYFPRSRAGSGGRCAAPRTRPDKAKGPPASLPTGPACHWTAACLSTRSRRTCTAP
jgi:hypothetical protein